MEEIVRIQEEIIKEQSDLIKTLEGTSVKMFVFGVLIGILIALIFI